MIPQYIPSYNREVIAKEVCDYILGDNFFSENMQTREFESKLAKFLDVRHCITCNNGTMALSLALLAHGVKPGDNVLIPNITMMSTQAAVQLIGAKPIQVDVDPRNLCMDLKQARKYIEECNIKAVIYVALNGRTHSLMEISLMQEYCKNQSIAWIEDNAQAFGSQYDDAQYLSCPTGGIGCFSLSFHKLLSTGQGGFCVTNNDRLATRLRELKNVGRVDGGADVHERFGINNKFTDIQAIIGLVELRDIDYKIMQKKTNFMMYGMNLEDVKEITFLPTDLGHTVPWFVDIFCEKRTELQQFLKDNGVGTRAIYPELTSQEINRKWYKESSLKVSGKYTKTGLWLPSSLSLNPDDIKDICNKIKRFYNE